MDGNNSFSCRFIGNVCMQGIYITDCISNHNLNFHRPNMHNAKINSALTNQVKRNSNNIKWLVQAPTGSAKTTLICFSIERK